jgi:enoyl-CoA hydratase/3-hydroxyacyl-CoA dehydrogenase
VEMIFYPVVNEASRALEENVVVRSSDLDIASVLGMGFPAYRGGVVFWGDSVGREHIYSKLNQWSSQYGPFFKPSGPLQRAVHGKYQLVCETQLLYYSCPSIHLKGVWCLIKSCPSFFQLEA